METPSLIAILPVRNLVLFPGLVLPLRVTRQVSQRALDWARKEGDLLVTVAQKLDTTGREPGADDLYRVGTLAKIERVTGTAEEGYQVIVRGIRRFRINAIQASAEGALLAQGAEVRDATDMDGQTEKALLESVKLLTREILELIPADTRQLTELLSGIEDLSYLINLCAGNLEAPIEKKQELLDAATVKAQALLLLDLLQQRRDALLVENEIRDKLSHKMGKGQREAILREQLKTIREELGDDSNSRDEDYRKRIEAAKMPDDAKKVALEELKRLESVGNTSPEAHIIRNYLDLLCSLPWAKGSTESIDLVKSREILDVDHYGLSKIKKRILQHLAVMKLRGSARGSILLFVGPPGVGKTSLGQSIAKALGRKFVRGSLGGVRDDAEIRGHRRTYIGAMPGRIIQGIKRSGENNPVFMLDEIDKLGRGFQGDPAAALLEVLDPEQNATFLDHYLDVPFDLSKVFFIATANSLEGIPGPLLDRMELIDLSGYTTAEKLHIAKNHLIPKQLKEHGLTEKDLVFGDEALLRVITHHTREAGVRDLQRHIAGICRWATEKVVSSESQASIRLETKDLEDILGPERFRHEVAELIAPPGVATGLAWTPVGGEILFIEASLMPGNGNLLLTGSLGDVMKESAQIAQSLVRSRLPEIVPGFEFKRKDLHIHVPSGAIPKDGPSAGIAILTTIASLFSGRRVNPKLAMTGEITLRGAVMPVGGIKEKVMAAHRAGIERVLLPLQNEKDLREVPEEVKSHMRFDFVDNVSQVLKYALGIDVPHESMRTLSNPSSHSPPAVAQKY